MPIEYKDPSTGAIIYIPTEDDKQKLEDQKNLYDFPQQINEKIDTFRNDTGVHVQDYGAVGDGVTDSTTGFQNVLNIAKTKGSVTIYVPDGTFCIKKRLIVYGNTKIIMSPNTILRREAVTSFFANGEPTDNKLLYNGNSNITIIGGTLDGNNATYPLPFAYFSLAHAKNLTFKDITFKDGFESHAFELSALDNVLIENCRFLGHKWGDVNRNYVEAIQIDINTKPAFPAFGGYDGTPTKNVTIRNCYFGKGNNGSDGWSAAIGNHGALHNAWNENITVDNCYFEGMTYSAIRGFKWKDSKVLNNKFVDCVSPILFEIPSPNSASTIDINGVQSGVTQPNYRILIEGNTLINTLSSDAISVKGNNAEGVTVYSESITIRDNNIIGTNANNNAISISHGMNINVSGNYAENCRRLLFMHNSVQADIHDNKDVNSIFNLVNADSSTKVNVHNNQSLNAGNSGIIISSTSLFSVHDNYVENASSTADVSANGIHVNGTSNTGRIYNNTVVADLSKNSIAYGLRILNTCSNVTTFNNDLQGKNGKYDNQQTTKGDTMYMHSPNGTRYKVTISDAGSLSATQG